MNKKIAIFLPDNALGMSAMLTKELCWVASQRAMETESGKEASTPQVLLISEGCKTVHCYTGTQLLTDGDLDELQDCDALFLTAFWGDPQEVMTQHQALMPWLHKLHDKQIPIAAISNAPFFLGEAGLLDNKISTIYTPTASLFERCYPQVNLRIERAISVAENLYCANGLASGCDLIISIIESLFGTDISNSMRHDFLLGFNRNYSIVSSVFDGQKYHGDAEVIRAQQWLESNFYREVTIDDLAREQGLSPRQFNRRFQQATGDTPLQYLQKVRVEVAKELLETTQLTKREIADRVGYSDPGHFRRIFLKHAGCLPQDYKA